MLSELSSFLNRLSLKLSQHFRKGSFAVPKLVLFSRDFVIIPANKCSKKDYKITFNCGLH